MILVLVGSMRETELDSKMKAIVRHSDESRLGNIELRIFRYPKSRANSDKKIDNIVGKCNFGGFFSRLTRLFRRHIVQLET